MKKLNIGMLSCAVALAAVLVVSLAMTESSRETEKMPSSTSVYSSSKPFSSQGSASAAASLPSTVSAGKQAVYLVKTYNGKIGIFRAETDKPFRVLDVNVNSLPKADQELLRSGISVQSSEELQTIIEDYVS